MKQALTTLPQGEQEPYRLTILKVSPAESARGKRYAKDLSTNVLNLPYFNNQKTLLINSFEQLHDTYKRLLDQPQATQILGVPNTKDALVRRSLSNFSFYETPTQAEPVLYNYLILDIDKPLPDELTLPDFTPTEENVEKQAKLIVNSLTDTKDISIIVRLSSSFGIKPGFRAHLIIPLQRPVSIAKIEPYLSQYDFIDSTMYRNPTQPIYTAAPLVQGMDDPLGPLDANIPRLYYFPGSNKFPTHPFTNIPNKPPKHATSKIIKAHELPGERGVYNRAARTNTDLDLPNLLLSLGYLPSTNPNKYTSPSSTSGSPGTQIYPEGYVFDFHDNSPIQDLLHKHSNSRRTSLTAYDLARLIHRDRETLPQFRSQIKRLTQADITYQNYWESRIKSSLAFITEALTVPEVDALINAYVEDIFLSQLSHGRKQGLFESLVKLSPKIDGYKITLGTLNKTYSTIRQKLASDLLEIHPDNKDYLNAQAFLANVRALYKSNGHWILDTPTGLTATALTEDVLRIVSKQMREMSLDPVAWNLNKLDTAAKAALRIATERADDPNYEVPPIQDHLFKFPDSSKGINIFTQEIVDISLDLLVLNQLPFTEEEYLNRPKFDKHSNFYKFLHSTFKGNDDRIIQIRDLYTYLLLPNRKTHLIYALVGVPRSGKTTLKNLIRELLGGSRYMETSPESMRDDFGLSRLTTETRLLIINEFNASEISRKNGYTQTGGKLVNNLKMISGRDEVIIREMRENPRAIRTDALPLILSNELPTISDRAFQNRLQVIKFEHMFADLAQKDTGEFMDNLIKELPTIFHWAITNGDIQNFEFTPTKTAKEDKRETTEAIDIYGGFFRRFMEKKRRGFITKKEMRHFFGCYFYKRQGFSPSPEDLSPQRFGLNVLGAIFPTAEPKRRAAEPGLPRKVQESMGRREWGYEGIAWRDLDGMIQELSEFADFIE